jgi:hypothetical protein
MGAPPIDQRTRSEVVRQVRRLMGEYAPSWLRGLRPDREEAPWPDNDPGAALVEIFGHFMEVILERLNRVPDKNLLAFLDMIGIGLLPPQAARAPVEFFLAAGATEDVQVPAGTPLGTTGPEPQTFETESALTVTPAPLKRAVTFDAEGDVFTEHGGPGQPFDVFRGTTAIEHALHVREDTLFSISRPVSLTLRLELGDATQEHIRLFRSLAWSVRAGGTQVRLPSTLAPAGSGLRGTVHTGGIASATLTGVGTTFTKELGDGDALFIPGIGNRSVGTITSDTSLTLFLGLGGLIAAPGVPAVRVHGLEIRGLLTTNGVESQTVAGGAFLRSFFTRDLAPGDTIAIPGVGTRVVTAVASDTSFTIDVPATIPAPNSAARAMRVRPVPLAGTVHTAGAASTTLAGVGTRFTQELLPGEMLGLPDQPVRRVKEISSDTSLTLDAAVLIPGPPGVAAVRLDPPSLRGTVHTGGASSTTVLGQGTFFTREVAVGDVIAILGVGNRTVTAIASDTSLTIDAPASITAPGVAADRRRRLLIEVDFDNVPAIEASTINGVTAPWLSARTTRPILVPTAELPRVDAIGAKTALKTPMPPDMALANNAPLELNKGGFFPFGERPRINDAFYLNSAEVFSRAGASVGISIDLAFPIRPDPDQTPTVTLTWEFLSASGWQTLATITPPLYIQLSPRFIDNTRAFTVAGQSTIGFTCPPVIRGEVAGQPGYWIRVRITGGSYGQDARLVKKAGSTTNSLADWDYAPPTFRPPFITALTLTYTYEKFPEYDFQDVQDVVTLNNFVYEVIGRTPEGALVPFRPFQAPATGDAGFYLGFERRFSNRPVTIYLAVLEQPELPAGAMVTWEYWNGAAWRSLGVQDATKNLTQADLVQFIGPADLEAREMFGPPPLYWIRARRLQGDKARFALSGVHPNAVWAWNALTLEGEVVGSSTGEPNQGFTLSRAPVLTGQDIEVREGDAWTAWQEVPHFAVSGPQSRHYVVDRTTGRLRFGDGARGMIPPPGRDNVRARRYRTGGGRKGNVPAGAIAVLKRGIASIDRVSNPAPAGGGANLETLPEVMVRGPLTIRHRDRAVTREDYESLAREASINVARARAVGATGPTSAGVVTLLIVPDSDDPKPLPSPGLLRRVREYLDARRLATVDLSLVGPRYVEVSVTAEVVPVSFEDADLVRRRVLGNLGTFLHALKGGPDGTGWDFGRDVYVSEVASVIERTEGVDHVKTVTLGGTAADGDRTREDGRRVQVHGDDGELPASGTQVAPSFRATRRRGPTTTHPIPASRCSICWPG